MVGLGIVCLLVVVVSDVVVVGCLKVLKILFFDLEC